MESFSMRYLPWVGNLSTQNCSSLILKSFPVAQRMDKLLSIG